MQKEVETYEKEIERKSEESDDDHKEKTLLTQLADFFFVHRDAAKQHIATLCQSTLHFNMLSQQESESTESENDNNENKTDEEVKQNAKEEEKPKQKEKSQDGGDDQKPEDEKKADKKTEGKSG